MTATTVIAPLPAALPKVPALDPHNPCNAAVIYGEKDISFARKQEIIQSIHLCGTRPTTLPVVRGDAQRQLGLLIEACNFRIWRHPAHNSADPNPEQRSALRERVRGDAQYGQWAREVAALTCLLKCLAGVEEAASRAHADKWAAQVKEEKDARLLAEFEAHEATDKQRRFQAWKINRGP